MTDTTLRGKKEVNQQICISHKKLGSIHTKLFCLYYKETVQRKITLTPCTVFTLPILILTGKKSSFSSKKVASSPTPLLQYDSGVDFSYF